MLAQLHPPTPAHPITGARLEPEQIIESVATFVEALADAREVTYGLLKKAQGSLLTEEALSNGRSLQRVHNCNTAVNAWMRQFRLTDESPVGAEFGEGFNASLDEHIKGLQSEGKSKQTIDDRRSFLGKCRETWAHLLQALCQLTASGDFGQTLGDLIESSGMSISRVAREVRISATTLGEWIEGRVKPSKKSLAAVHRLEVFFRLPYSALAARLPRFLAGSWGCVRTGLTGYRKHFREVNQSRYFLRAPLPGLQEEFDRAFSFYTDAAWLRLHRMKRNSKWRVREHDGRCPTAERVFAQVRRFLGYLSLPPNDDRPVAGGKGYLPEELTMALLSDSDLIYDYLQFKKERTYLRQYNTDTKTYLEFCSAILRPETGFLWQSPQLGAKLPSPVAASEWHSWCERHRAVIKATLRDLTKEDEFKKTRDPFDAVRPLIVNNQHPLDVLNDLADAYEAERPPRNASKASRAAHFQFLFLIKFATLLPLRAFNFSVMTYRADNTGNLYQRPDGSWWVTFSTTYLKNHKGAAKGDPFDVPLHESLWPYAEEFLFDHRPHLVGAGECDYVFRLRKSLKGAKPLAPVRPGYLSNVVYNLSQRYIPDCPGFSLHAFRHLVATEYIKNNPGGYAVAAAVLHDKEETVRRSYAWVVPADKFFFWNQYVDAQRDRRRIEEEEISQGVV
jgi:transcriptional regulator with XRE-family HTH domain